jgi:hypothetical protein
MSKPRRRIKQTQSFQERLRAFAKLMRESSETMAKGPEKAATSAKADQAEAAAKLDGWLNSSELRPPK